MDPSLSFGELEVCIQLSSLLFVAIMLHCLKPVFCIAGLYDTVFDVDHDKDRARSHGLEPNGFSFDGADSNSVDYGLNRQVPRLTIS